MMFCCDLISVDFIHIIQGYFMGTAIAIDQYQWSIILYDLGWNIDWFHNGLIDNHSKTIHNKKVCIFYGIYCE